MSVPTLRGDYGRGNTRASARRGGAAMASNVNSVAGDVVNQASAAHATFLPTGVSTTITGGAGASAVVWPAATYDLDGWYSAGAPSRLTVTRAGIYLVQACVQWNKGASATGTYFTYIYKNGAFGGGSGEAAGAAVNPIFIQDVFQHMNLAAGDYLQIFVQAGTDDGDVIPRQFGAIYLGTAT